MSFYQLSQEREEQIKERMKVETVIDKKKELRKQKSLEVWRKKNREISLQVKSTNHPSASPDMNSQNRVIQDAISSRYRNAWNAAISGAKNSETTEKKAVSVIDSECSTLSRIEALKSMIRSRWEDNLISVMNASGHMFTQPIRMAGVNNETQFIEEKKEETEEEKEEGEYGSENKNENYSGYDSEQSSGFQDVEEESKNRFELPHESRRSRTSSHRSQRVWSANHILTSDTSNQAKSSRSEEAASADSAMENSCVSSSNCLTSPTCHPLESPSTSPPGENEHCSSGRHGESNKVKPRHKTSQRSHSSMGLLSTDSRPRVSHLDTLMNGTKSERRNQSKRLLSAHELRPSVLSSSVQEDSHLSATLSIPPISKNRNSLNENDSVLPYSLANSPNGSKPQLKPSVISLRFGKPVLNSALTMQ